MSIAEDVLEKLQALPLDKQQEILDFAEFLYQKFHRPDVEQKSAQPTPVSPSALGKRLRALRAEIVASGERLLTAEEIEQKIAEQRDRFRDLEP